MTEPAKRHTGVCASSIYRIRVAGALDAAWAERALGMEVRIHGEGAEGTNTELIGALPDQAALMGVIDRLYSYGAQLLSVECVPAGDD